MTPEERLQLLHDQKATKAYFNPNKLSDEIEALEELGIEVPDELYDWVRDMFGG